MHGRTLGRRTATALVAAMGLLLAAGAGSAAAATVSKTGDTITYTAVAGETNTAAITHTGGTLQFTDSTAPLSGDCTSTACPDTGVSSIVVNLGDADDTVTAANVAVPVTVDGGDGFDGVSYDGQTGAVTLKLDDAGLVKNVEDITGGSGNDTLTGSALFNVLDGGPGTDVLDAGPGEDHVLGDDGNDTITARDGFADLVDCGLGTDTAIVDTFDRVGSSCETVSRAAVSSGREDAQPRVAFAGPTENSLLRTTSSTMVTATAADDRGIARVMLIDDGKVVATDTEAPYLFRYRPSASDVGRNPLIVVAEDTGGQTATAMLLTRVPRFVPRNLSAQVTPTVDRVPAFRFRVTGRLQRPSYVSQKLGCGKGYVRVQVKRGSRLITSRNAKLGSKCGFSARFTYLNRVRIGSSRLRFTVRFLGNSVLSARSAPSVYARTR